MSPFYPGFQEVSMTYHQIIQLKNGASCCLRSGTAADGQAALDNFILTHAETDNLLTYRHAGGRIPSGQNRKPE